MKDVKRRALRSVVVLAALALVTAGCLLYRGTRPPAVQAAPAAVTQAADPLTRFRTERQQLRQKQHLRLRKLRQLLRLLHLLQQLQ